MTVLVEAARRSWLSLLVQSVDGAIRPPELHGVHASGPLPYRALLIGGGIAVGFGVTRAEVALPGHLARHLASITGRGVDLDVTAEAGMTLMDARAELDGCDLSRYDLIVVTLGAADALAGLSADVWRGRLELFLAGLLGKTSPVARVVVIGGDGSTWSPYLKPLLARRAARRMEELNDVSRELCWSFPRASYLRPCWKSSTDDHQYSIADYDRCGRAVAAHLVRRLPRQVRSPSSVAASEPSADLTLAGLGLLGLDHDVVTDRVVARVRSVFGVEGAALTVLGRTEVWPKSVIGVHEQHATPRDDGLPFLAAAQQGGLAVRNLREDSRFRESRLARRVGIAFYAGHPVRGRSGECVAVLTIVDPRPRTFSDQEMALLRDHALLIEDALSAPPSPGRDPGRRERASLQPDVRLLRHDGRSSLHV